MKRLLLAALLFATGCLGSAELFDPKKDAPEAESGGGGGGGGGATGDLSNGDVYTRLKVTCGGCHTLTDRPYFATLETFENLIVYDAKYVVPKQPDNSHLLKMLEATGLPQMPPSPGASFKTIAEAGNTQITIPELREWILNLEPRVVPQTPVDVPAVRRKTAEQVVKSLYDQLGLVETDFYNAAWDPKAGDSYAVRSPDAIPYADPFDQGGTLFSAMGGPYRLEGNWRNDAPTSGFAQALTHVSQAWCRTAFQKSGNTAVWTKATVTDVSTNTAGAQKIKDNISDLYLRMLGQDATAAEVDDLFNNVFVKYEAKGATTAWTAVCASLVRDPLWILY